MLKTNELGAEPYGPRTPRHQGCGISDIDLLWKWYKLRIHYKITCEFYPRFALIKGFSYALESLKPMSYRGRSSRTTARGMESPVDSAWYENLLWNYIKSKLIKLQFNIVTNILRHYLKMHESEDMIKTEARQTWSDRVNFTLRNRFSWTFKVLNSWAFGGSAPCTLTRGVAPGPHQGP